MNRADTKSICQLLDRLNIPYRRAEHPAAGTMEELAQAEEQLGVEIFKNLFLRNRQGTAFYLLLLPKDKRFRTSQISKLIGASRLSFAGEEQMYEYLGVHPGAVTPLGLVFDEAHQVRLLIDRDLLNQEELGMHPCENTSSLALKTSDLMEVYLPFTGHKPQLLDIPEEE